MALFDRYIAVDWSANNTPKRGRDSIWSGMAIAERSAAETANHPTRRTAEAWLRDQLVRAVAAHERVLVGLDFPYGYPLGFARALGVTGWTGTWAYLDRRIHDEAENRSNRFGVAAEINARLGKRAPFWGCPASCEESTLSPRKDVRYRGPEAPDGLPEFRAVEDRLRSLGAAPQPAWKLAYAGSVGSQSLVGIPMLNRLRFGEELRDVSRVWPFEVGEPTLPAGTAAIVHAEIWPSMVPFADATGCCRDEKQVRAVAQHFRALDQDARLGELFAVGSTSRTVREEEGWILGVPTRS